MPLITLYLCTFMDNTVLYIKCVPSASPLAVNLPEWYGDERYAGRCGVQGIFGNILTQLRRIENVLCARCSYTFAKMGDNSKRDHAVFAFLCIQTHKFDRIPLFVGSGRLGTVMLSMPFVEIFMSYFRFDMLGTQFFEYIHSVGNTMINTVFFIVIYRKL